MTEVINATVSVTNNVITLPSNILQSSHIGFFVEGEGLPSGSFITSITTIQLTSDPDPITYGYYCDISESIDLPLESVEVKIISPIIKIASQLTKATDTSELILAVQETFKNQALGDGIHTISPWEWLGLSSIVRYYDENGIDLATLKTRVDSLPKSI